MSGKNFAFLLLYKTFVEAANCCYFAETRIGHQYNKL